MKNYSHRLLGFAVVALFISGCGANMKVIRQYMANSPHRSLAVLPFDMVHGEKNFSQPAADMMENKLRRLGYLVADHSKTRSLYNHSDSKNRLFDDAATAAELGRQLGVQAILIGAIDESFERLFKRPPEYQIITNPTPACCGRAQNPCSSRLVYDPVTQSYVDSCGPTHRKIRIASAFTVRHADFAARARLIDTATAKVIWESSQRIQSDQLTLLNTADQATDAFAEQMIQDYMKLGL